MTLSRKLYFSLAIISILFLLESFLPIQLL
jgi:hypothetical protein